MMTKTEGDVENPIPEEQTAAEEGVPVPEQAPPSNDDGKTTKTAGSKNEDDTKKKKAKALALTSFILVAAALAFGLGFGLQDDCAQSLTLQSTIPNPGTGLTYGDVDPEEGFLRTAGPIQSRGVRIINPGIANGYLSCADMKEDLREALKHFANKLIVRESMYSNVLSTCLWKYEKCDPNNPNWNLWDNYYYYTNPCAEEEDYIVTQTSLDMGDGESIETEDSFGTNNQVEGVDEADIVKSDGTYVFAAYGDLLYVWNATDATKGTSITKMPYAEFNEADCHANAPDHYWHCHKAQPRIESLLFDGSRLTAIVSEDDWRGLVENKPKPIINDYTKLTVRVYDISDVDLDGSPLALLGEREIKGTYDSARSVGTNAFVITRSRVDTHSFANDLHRHRSQFCGLKSTEYEALASDIALRAIEPWINQLLDELQLQLDGSCDTMFQISAMQSGDTDADNSYDGDMLRQLVQVQGFDMASIKKPVTNSFVLNGIALNVAAAFSSGRLETVYASHNFAATINVGNHYNSATKEWDESTFILGFSTKNGSTPKPFAVAEIPGKPLNQYSTDLYEGHLRTITTERQNRWGGSSRTTNKMFVLKVPDEGQGQELKVVGETGHIGKPNEEVKSVRFIKEKAYIVTFERTDPFYIYDLSVPEKPKKLGELEIPGFSSYLHPIVLDEVPYILGVGTDGNLLSVGLKISLFDVSNDTNPIETVVFVDKGASSSANYDFKSFRWLSKSRMLIIPNSKYGSSWRNSFNVYSIASDNIEPIYEIQHATPYDMGNGCWYSAYMPARSFVFQSKLTTILAHTVKSTDLESGKELWNMTLGEGLADKDNCGPYFV